VKVTTLETIVYYIHEDRRSVVFEQISSYEVNGVKGYGIFEFLYRNPRLTEVNIPPLLPLLKEPKVLNDVDVRALSLDFTHPACVSSRLVGGKGCQLAMLTQLQHTLSVDYKVPQGFCLTIAAFQRQLLANPDVKSAVSNLQQISCKTPSDLKSACNDVMKCFQKMSLCDDVVHMVIAGLNKMFDGQSYNGHGSPVAVRSSATGEDGSELSAAGQMLTFLGVRGIEQICDAIRNCWASHFDFPAVMYRRQHGQAVDSSTGVVIQQMAPCKAAGVLFTKDPVTRNPGVMVLNANYGLGESVVSGEAEPDQVTIQRCWNDDVTILNKKIGSKARQVILAADGGTRTEENAGASAYCLDDDVILKLARVGVELETRFGDARDIEFAVDSGNIIYLLQARPITTLDQESEWQLLHEFDTGLATDREYQTTANVQEMMPGAMTPLTVSFFYDAIDFGGQSRWVSFGLHPDIHMPNKFVTMCCSKAFLNMSFVFSNYEGNNFLGDKRMAELAILGATADDYSIQEVVSYNGRFPLWRRLLCTFRTVKMMFVLKSVVNKWRELSETFCIAEHEHTNCAQLYEEISQQLPLMSQTWDFHMWLSSGSGIWSSVLMTILTNRALVWTSEHVSDVALLLSKCENVYSADVPTALKKLAITLSVSEHRETFLKFTPEEAVTWIKSSASGAAGVEFQHFLNKHGHRCVREAELREKSWRAEPTKVIKVIQAMVLSEQNKSSLRETSEEKIDATQLISRLKSPTTSMNRSILKMLMPKAWKAVGERELAKSIAIKISDTFKEAYFKLGAMMVQESRLPDEDLIFFLTHRELGTVLATRSAKLIMRAQKRRQLLVKQMDLNFPRVFFGHVEPTVKEVLNENSIVLKKLTGMPVSQGIVSGNARVVTCLEDAASIQNGEILVVPFTDIGWSPYFPLISGLATEIGGLLSHGAVVAREYGLPCVVNLNGATQHFQTGDRVILNGTIGTLEKIEIE